MKYQRSIGNGSLDFLQPAKVQPDFSFVEPMSSPDRNCKSVYVCLSHKPCGIVRFSQKLCRYFGAFIVLSDMAQLTFNRHTSRMCELNYASRHRTIIGKRHFGAVDHYGGISLVNTSRC